MTVKEMREALCKLPFSIFWPDKKCEKLMGYCTEREVWVNAKGFGTFYCDEPNCRYKIKSIPADVLHSLKQKISDETITWNDIQDTPLSKIYWFECEEEFRLEKLIPLLDLPDELGGYFYWVDTFEDGRFFTTQEEMNKYVAEDAGARYIDESWEDMSDEAIQEWYECIFEDNGLGKECEIPFEVIE